MRERLARLRARLATPPVAIGALVFLVAAGLVALTLRRPEPPAFTPSPVAPREAGERLVGPSIYTVDAADAAAWRFFDFSRGSLVERPGPLDWDLAFRRYNVIANGGPTFEGRGGIADLGEVAFEGVLEAPAGGYQPTRVRGDSVNAGVGKWYEYGFSTHLLTPKPRVYAVRTADGRYAKLEILGYYCPGARPGCLTFRYVYQGDGSRALQPGSRGIEPEQRSGS